jgi:transcriptional/translational regulatory protein YebC/TACO1
VKGFLMSDSEQDFHLKKLPKQDIKQAKAEIRQPMRMTNESIDRAVKEAKAQLKEAKNEQLEYFEELKKELAKPRRNPTQPMRMTNESIARAVAEAKGEKPNSDSPEMGLERSISDEDFRRKLQRKKDRGLEL